MDAMTAYEVIKQIKSLPPKERAKVVGFIHEMKSEQAEDTLDSRTFEQSAAQVFDWHAELMQKLSQ